MKRVFLALLVIVLYVLHQDIWFWRTAQPIVFGFLPIGLFYHVVYTLAVCLVMGLLVNFAWPAQLEATDTATGRHDDTENLAASPQHRVPASIHTGEDATS